MVRMVRSLFCALLAVLVAMLVAPAPLAHAAAPLDHHAGVSSVDHPGADGAERGGSDHEHLPGKACGDCCHHATCHMKAAPAAQDLSFAFDLQSVRFRTSDFIAPYGAPASRNPDPERS